MKKYILLFILLPLVQCVFAKAMQNSEVKTSQQIAYKIAKAKMGNDNTYKYYVSKDLVMKGAERYWLVFVDKVPKAGWEHPCSYVYVNNSSTSTDKAFVIDSVCPPSDIRLIPIIKSNAADDDIVKINLLRGPENKYASHTYAVILSGGKDKNSNNSRYWNDCSFIYQTLTKTYNVPKANVKVLMSDGTDPAEDMCNELGSEYFSSPLDLDGDGQPDIDCSATNANLKKILSNYASMLGDEDHLFVYVIDHGGYDKQKKTSYISMWNGERLYPEELNRYLSGCEAGYISLLMGQCNAGGFVKPLQANNRIIMSACGDGEKDYSYACEEIPFDEYVYRWTSSLAGYDAYGNLLSDILYKTNSLLPYNRTLKYAHAYACKNDIYTSEDALVTEIPQISIFENSTADDLTFDYVPDVCELYITSGEEPTTPRGVIELPDKYLNIDFSRPIAPQVAGPQRLVYWNSADIWLRRQKDGLTNRLHQDGCLGEDEEKVYVYTKIRNRGVKTYDSSSKQLRIWWARSAMKIDMKTWLGKKTSVSKGVYGNSMGWASLYDTLAPGDSTIVCMDYTFSNGYLEEARKKDFNACLLAFIVDENDAEDDFGDAVDDSTMIAKVWATKRMAQKNLTSAFEKEQPSTVIPYFKGLETYNLRITANNGDSAVFNRMNVSLNVSNGSVSSWIPQEKTEASAKKVSSADILNKVMLADNCVIRDIVLTGKNTCAVTLTAEQIASENVLKDRYYTINVELYDSKFEKSLGGQSFIVRQKARKKIDFSVSDKLDGMGNYELYANNPSENLTYLWKDNEGNVVGTGANCNVPANAKSCEYTVEAKSTTDGAVNYKSVSLERISKINNVRQVSDTEILVNFSSPADKNTSLRLSSASSGQTIKDYRVEEGSVSIVIPTGQTPKGVSSVGLVENGKLTETVKLMK